MDCGHVAIAAYLLAQGAEDVIAGTTGATVSIYLEAKKEAEIMLSAAAGSRLKEATAPFGKTVDRSLQSVQATPTLSPIAGRAYNEL